MNSGSKAGKQVQTEGVENNVNEYSIPARDLWSRPTKFTGRPRLLPERPTSIGCEIQNRPTPQLAEQASAHHADQNHGQHTEVDAGHRAWGTNFQRALLKSNQLCRHLQSIEVVSEVPQQQS
jgi:hypothetical protein